MIPSPPQWSINLAGWWLLFYMFVLWPLKVVLIVIKRLYSPKRIVWVKNTETGELSMEER